MAGSFLGTAAKGEGWTSLIRSAESSVNIHKTPIWKSFQKSSRMSNVAAVADLKGGVSTREVGAEPSIRVETKCSVVYLI